MSHTSGPWKARGYKNGNGDIWIDCNAFANNGKGKCLGGTLATTHKDGTGKGSVEANARLIAAAPELLELAKRALAIMGFHDARCPIHPTQNFSGSEEHCSEYRHVMSELKELIAKVQGKEE